VAAGFGVTAARGLSHRRRVLALLSSTNSHKRASLAQRRIRRRPAQVSKSAADHNTELSEQE
jgi:hypothetical protein